MKSEIDESIPNRAVLLEDICYCIHGLIHGTPFVRINPAVKREVNRQLSGCRVICEDGFTSWIKGSESMDEIGYFHLGKLSLPAIFSTLKYIFSYLGSLDREPDIIAQVREMDSISDMNGVRSILFQGYLPEPEGMNSFLLKLNRGTLDNPNGELPLRVKRYVYEAGRSVEYAKENHLGELHIVAGCAHELPLEYLLKNPKTLNNLLKHLIF